MKKKLFIYLPLIAMVAYTIGAFFLTFSSSEIYFSPGKSGFAGIDTGLVSAILVILTAVLLLGVIIQHIIYRKK